MRDANFSNLADGTHGLVLSSNQWGYSGTSDTTDIFTRTLTVSTVNIYRKKLTSVVQWTDSVFGVNSVTLDTYLTNWNYTTPQAGLTVNKTVINHGLSKTTSDFAPYVASSYEYLGDPPVSTLVQTDMNLGEAKTLDANSYTITETTDSNYTQTFTGDCNSFGQITLAGGDAKICNIINEEKPSYLTVTKIVSGGTKQPSDFSLFVDSTPVTSGSTNSFNSGLHIVSETPDSSYASAFSGDCNSSGQVTLVTSTTKSCNLTNTYIGVIPTITTPTSSSIASTTATLGANVTSLGIPASISARGTCWGTSPSPTTNCLAEGGTTTGIFTQARTGFSAGVTYYYRGYATNATGTAYSADATFTTLVTDCTGTPWGTMASGTSNTAYQSSSVTYPATCTSETRTCTNGTLSGTYTNTSCSVLAIAPTVTTTSPITSITRTTATGGGNVTSGGGATVTARGVVWSTSTNPTIALSTKTSDGTGTGSFTSSLTSLTCNTLYYVRAYATNSAGTSYGSNVTFTTSACSSITFVGANSGNGTPVTVPAHVAGDLLLVFAYKSGNNTPPTVPSGWTTIDASGSANNSSALAYKIAVNTSDTATGFAGANEMVIQVYRGVAASPIGAGGVPQFANSTTVTYPALTLSVTDGSSWVVGSAGAASNSSNVQNAPTGMTSRTNIVGGSAEASGFDTNGGVSSWTAQTVVINPGNVKWSARTLEIRSQ